MVPSDPHPTVVYEVVSTAREDLVARYEQFLRAKHVREVMATGASESATQDRAGNRLPACLAARPRDELSNHLARHAPHLRQEVLVRFPEDVATDREEWLPLASFRSGNADHA